MLTQISVYYIHTEMTAAVVSQTAFISHSQLMISAIRHRLWDVYSSLWSLLVCVKEVKSSCVTPFLHSCIGGRHQIKLSEVQWLWKTAPHDSQLDISCQSWNTLNFALPPFFFFCHWAQICFFFLSFYLSRLYLWDCIFFKCRKCSFSWSFSWLYTFLGRAHLKYLK